MPDGDREGGRTLLVSEIFPPRIGGSGTWFWEIYRRLPRSRYAVLAGAHENAERFDAAGEIDVARADLSSSSWSLMEASGLRYYARMLGEVRRVARAKGARRLQCARVMPEGVVGYAGSWLLGLPYVCFVHGEDVRLARESRESRLVARRVLGRAQLLVCNSESSARLLREDWSIAPERIRVMHPGVDTERFAPLAEADARALRERFGWRGRKVVLTVSRLEKRKGHDRMIEAMEEIRRAVPEALYAIVGDGDEREALVGEIARRGLGRWVSLIDTASDEELPRYYQASDLFILPNRSVGSSVEGFGIVLLEAQASGKAVIAGDSGGTAETMDVGMSGTIVDATDPSAIAAEVIRLLRDDAERLAMGERARRRAVERFAWEELAGKAAEVFDGAR